ncbi:isoprenylcysteine carboxyl methyltransferase family protein [Dongia soli]|uniref:Isoprenylcysteine carboxylmethyltransferase family protein n=1 Tax=Dongia soli TaxID=600628 RepID=A0ABU5EEP6_9PROT|nr:isoprenylcysteine carboxylmethyltransferase family protein [Dongia soli]MDY0884015.1 isoprenylcysteine carboxylmethyltransferase family protein [Dongia soli]
MNSGLVLFVILAVLFRLLLLVISVRHERALKKDGAIEIGAKNSLWLMLAHIAFYAAAVVEGSIRGAQLDAVSGIGIILYVFGMAMLVVVLRLLGRFWTVKLLIASDHVLVTHPLFRWVRHPNYFLNILPELVGFALALHAYATLIVGLVIYAVPLAVRIRQEETAMRTRFVNY